MKRKSKTLLISVLFMVSMASGAADRIPVYSVYEIIFRGMKYSAADNPVRDILLLTTWQNKTSGELIRVYGYFDGDGRGGINGNIFRVRFCPVSEGQWTLTSVISNDRNLNRQNEGLQVTAEASDRHGFWIPDPASPGSRWYKRSDGTHQYITGNTMYSFLSEYFEDKPTGGNIKDDIINNSRYFKKVRIGVTGDRYPHPVSKPFLDESGKPTDDGKYSHRPNAEWFFNRLDLAVKTGYETDLITDLIISGPDTYESRSILKAEGNNGDPEPWLRYIAARYGSFPNVWICLANEFDIKEPLYKPEEIIRSGKILQAYLPYPTPVSVHSARHWTEELNSHIPWFDHVILQNKLKRSYESADNILINFILGGSRQPVIDDELAYEGAGDGWSEGDVIESFLGAFAGGGYASTGHKPANKAGHYFHGNFKADEHKAADNLGWFRKVIDERITFWKMRPVSGTDPDDRRANIFRPKFDEEWRVLAWEENEYAIAATRAGRAAVYLPEGKWQVTLYDLIAMTEKTISQDASGVFEFSFIQSRAQLVHLRKKDN